MINYAQEVINNDMDKYRNQKKNQELDGTDSLRHNSQSCHSNHSLVSWLNQGGMMSSNKLLTLLASGIEAQGLMDEDVKGEKILSFNSPPNTDKSNAGKTLFIQSPSHLL